MTFVKRMQVIIAEKEKDLQEMMNKICDSGDQFGLTFNIKKTKTWLSVRGA